MAPITFFLLEAASEPALLSALRDLPAAEQPLYAGQCHHWIHAPTLSVDALTSPGPTMQRWTHLLLGTSATLPAALSPVVSNSWSITGDSDAGALSALASAHAARKAKPPPQLPAGWSPADPSGLLAAAVPADLEASLGLSAVPLGAAKSSAPTPLKAFVRDWGSAHPGPVAMFNLLAYMPGQRPRYFKYIEAFQASVGSAYGGDPVALAVGVSAWSSRADEGARLAAPDAGGSQVWEDTALVWYPSLWHFAKMLDDPAYAAADRAYKAGVLRDNPLICCTELDL